MAIPVQTLLQQQRPVDQQVDVRNVLAAIGANYVRPQTSYVGLTPQNVAASAANTQAALAKQADMLQRAQQLGVQQDAARFDDAMRANQVALQSQQLDLSKAAHALSAQMQALRAQALKKEMGWADEDRQMKLEDRELQRALREEQRRKMKFENDWNEQHPDQYKTGTRQTTFDKKNAANLEVWQDIFGDSPTAKNLSGFSPQTLNKNYGDYLARMQKINGGRRIQPDQMQAMEEQWASSVLPLATPSERATLLNVVKGSFGGGLVPGVNPEDAALEELAKSYMEMRNANIQKASEKK